MDDSLQKYLSDKKVNTFRSKSFYKLKNYTDSYYIEKEVVERLSRGIQEVKLEKNTQSSSKKGLMKWDYSRKKIMISESKMRILYQPFDIV